jgi:hypothetical protein
VPFSGPRSGCRLRGAELHDYQYLSVWHLAPDSPGGRSENSPAVHCRVRASTVSVPKGRDSHTFRSSIQERGQRSARSRIMAPTRGQGCPRSLRRALQKESGLWLTHGIDAKARGFKRTRSFPLLETAHRFKR